jgi:hypothetical protein
MADKNQIILHNSESIQHFLNLLFAFIWSYKDANFVDFFFKFKMAAKTSFSIPAAILDLLKDISCVFEAKKPKLYLKRCIFLGKGLSQGQIPGLLGPGPKSPSLSCGIHSL